MDKRYFKAGAARINITPPPGTLINGDFVAHYARRIHDPLYAKALMLEDGRTRIAFVIVDICVMRQDFIADIKKEIFYQAAVKPENILIASTHTHAAGSVESLLLSAADLPYRKALKGLIIQVVLQAKTNMIPAKAAFGSANAPEHVVCRRYLMKPGYKAYNPVTGGRDKVKTNPSGHEDQIEKREGTTDPSVNYLAVQSLENKWISLLANYSMHYVGDWENGTVTADYFGVFAKQLSAALQAEDDFVAMMTNGTSGDANIVDFLSPDRYPEGSFEKSNMIGNDMAEKVLQSVKDLVWDNRPSLGVCYDELPVAVRKPSPGELNTALNIVKDTHYEELTLNEPFHTGNDDVLRKIYAREQVLLHEYPGKILFPVQAIKIGSGIIGGLGGEFFSETGLQLKEKIDPENYFTICLANGYTGYVPPVHAFGSGGYETWRCRSSFLEMAAESLTRNKLIKLISRLKR